MTKPDCCSCMIYILIHGEFCLESSLYDIEYLQSDPAKSPFRVELSAT